MINPLVNDIVQYLAIVILPAYTLLLTTRNFLSLFVFKGIPFLLSVMLFTNLLYQKGILFQ